MTTVKINFKELTPDLVRIRSILAVTDSISTTEVCDMYLELCQKIAEGVVHDQFTKNFAEVIHKIEKGR